MKVYYADTNVFLRFILGDISSQAKKARYYFSQAKKGQIKLIFLPEVIAEIEHILRKVYRLPKEEISQYLSSLIKSQYVHIDRRLAILNALEIYKNTNIDLVDIILFCTAKAENAQVLSFDKDVKKLQRRILD